MAQIIVLKKTDRSSDSQGDQVFRLSFLPSKKDMDAHKTGPKFSLRKFVGLTDFPRFGPFRGIFLEARNLNGTYGDVSNEKEEHL